MEKNKQEGNKDGRWTCLSATVTMDDDVMTNENILRS